MADENPNQTEEAPPPQAVVIQMLMSAWVSKALSEMGETARALAKFLDLNMMVFIPGKERTRKQWEELYTAAGMKIISVTPIADNFGAGIIEGVKV